MPAVSPFRAGREHSFTAKSITIFPVRADRYSEVLEGKPLGALGLAHLHEAFSRQTPLPQRLIVYCAVAVVLACDLIRRIDMPMRLDIRRIEPIAQPDVPMLDPFDLRGEAIACRGRPYTTTIAHELFFLAPVAAAL